jgi:hypothetical protein
MGDISGEGRLEGNIFSKGRYYNWVSGRPEI